MEEWIDVLDGKGKATGQHILKSEAHKKGVFHPTVHVWIYTHRGEVLLQQRAKTKKTFPLCWDVSVAGHIAAGEKVFSAAQREMQEELGLQVRAKDLVPIGVFKSVQRHVVGITDCEFHHAFLHFSTKPLTALTLQEEEVAGIELLPLQTWEEDLFSKSPVKEYVPHEPEYYREVIGAIRNRLKEIG